REKKRETEKAGEERAWREKGELKGERGRACDRRQGRRSARFRFVRRPKDRGFASLGPVRPQPPRSLRASVALSLTRVSREIRKFLRVLSTKYRCIMHVMYLR